MCMNEKEAKGEGERTTKSEEKSTDMNRFCMAGGVKNDNNHSNTLTYTYLVIILSLLSQCVRV